MEGLSEERVTSEQHEDDEYQHFSSPHQRRHDADAASAEASTPSPFQARRLFRNIGHQLQKINLARLIDEMEQDQELADHLEVINLETQEERDRKLLVQEARQATLQFLETHLLEYKQSRRQKYFGDHQQQEEVSYEEWIAELHPENAYPAMVPDKEVIQIRRRPSAPIEIDHRFYVEEADHRILWNKHADEDHQVLARAKMLRGMGVTEHHHDTAAGEKLMKNGSLQTVAVSEDDEESVQSELVVMVKKET